MAVYGRTELIQRIARSQAPVTLIVGDSGIGKSTVLTGAQEASDDAIAPQPRTLPLAGGVLQRAFLEALGDAVAELAADQGSAAAIGERLVNAARKLAEDRAHGLAIALGKELLGVVKARLGPDVGDAVADYIRQLKTTGDESLAARISAAADPGVVSLLIAFCHEVGDLAHRRSVLLALDAGERLRGEDIRLLGEVSEALPDAVRIRVAMSTHTPAHQEKADQLRIEAVSIVQVPPLDEPAVGAWLGAEGLPRELALDVLRATSGYALHIGDLVQHLRAGGAIADVPLNRQFFDRTMEAWNALDRHAKAAVRRLCVFGAPLPAERTERMLELNPSERAQLEDDLLRSRIFSEEVNGRPWFHEQRRQVLLTQVLSNGERAEASADAVEELLALGQQTESFERVAELAGLVGNAVRLLAADEQLASAVALDEDELAIAGALLELIDAEDPAVLGDVLLVYARETFGGANLVDALQRLGKRGLVAIVEDADAGAVAVVPYWHKPLVMTALIGRCMNELGRMPVPSVARALFQSEILPRLGRFETGKLGLGWGSAAALAEEIPNLRQPTSGLVVVTSDLGANLLIRAAYAGRPMYGVFTFGSAELRDQAHQAVAGFSTEVLGEPLHVTTVLDHPLDPVPARRFLRAAERLTGENFFASTTLTLDAPLQQEEAMRRKAQALRLIRDRCGAEERLAAQLEQPTGLAWSRETTDEGEQLIEVEIRGGREGVEEVDLQPAYVPGNPFEAFRLGDELKLSPGERIARNTVHHSREPSRQDPVLEVISLLHQRSRAFNRAQKRSPEVGLEPASLAERLTSAARRTLEDARALAAIPLGDEHAELTAQKTYAVIQLNPAHVGSDSVVLYKSLPAPDGSEEVFVGINEVGQWPPTDMPFTQTMNEHFGLDLGEKDYVSSARLPFFLADALGFDFDGPLKIKLP
jgi:hypothetical protein